MRYILYNTVHPFTRSVCQCVCEQNTNTGSSTTLFFLFSSSFLPFFFLLHVTRIEPQDLTRGGSHPEVGVHKIFRSKCRSATPTLHTQSRLFERPSAVRRRVFEITFSVAKYVYTEK